MPLGWPASCTSLGYADLRNAAGSLLFFRPHPHESHETVCAPWSRGLGLLERNRGVLYHSIAGARPQLREQYAIPYYIDFSLNINSLATNTITSPSRTVDPEGLVPQVGKLRLPSYTLYLIEPLFPIPNPAS